MNCSKCHKEQSTEHKITVDQEIMCFDCLYKIYSIKPCSTCNQKPLTGLVKINDKNLCPKCYDDYKIKQDKCRHTYMPARHYQVVCTQCDKRVFTCDTSILHKS